MKINTIMLGRIEYGEALALQKRLLELRQTGKIGDTLLLLEHEPVITLGIRGQNENILLPKEFLESKGVKIFEIDRGGDVTYHGPGQIVGYPIVNLSDVGLNASDFVDSIQQAFVNLLDEEFGFKAIKDHGKYTGVWVDNNKVTAIGISIKRKVSMHGFAFNVNTDLENFKWITPCGITDRGVTSIEKLTGKPFDINAMYEIVEKHICRALGLESTRATIEKLETHKTCSKTNTQRQNQSFSS